MFLLFGHIFGTHLNLFTSRCSSVTFNQLDIKVSKETTVKQEIPTLAEYLGAKIGKSTSTVVPYVCATSTEFSASLLLSEGPQFYKLACKEMLQESLNERKNLDGK